MHQNQSIHESIIPMNSKATVRVLIPQISYQKLKQSRSGEPASGGGGGAGLQGQTEVRHLAEAEAAAAAAAAQHRNGEGGGCCAGANQCGVRQPAEVAAAARRPIPPASPGVPPCGRAPLALCKTTRERHEARVLCSVTKSC